MMRAALAFGLVAATAAAQGVAPRPTCADWTECRTRALEAAERKDYEAFHDLAWRAVQLGPRHDHSLLYLLARAQSLSGRPHDALVMLRRLAPSGVAREAITSEEFAVVRTLRDWPDVESALASGTSVPAAAASTPPAAVVTTPAPADVRGTPAPASGVPDAFTFSAPSFRPSALAYDAVSRRFIISDSDVSRLAVIDEFSHHVATLVSGRSAGFGTVTAIEIDPRVGDLWVASVESSSGEERAALHRLQLISARVLKAYSPRETHKRFSDIAITREGVLLAVDGSAGRILRLRGGSAAFETMPWTATHAGVSSVTVSSDGTTYVATPSGIHRMVGGAVKGGGDVDLSGLARIRWYRGALIGLQASGDGRYRAVRIRLANDGRSVTRLDVLDPVVKTPNPAAATIVDGVLYYVTQTDGADFAIRRIRL